jgi:hypothetical protein
MFEVRSEILDPSPETAIVAAALGAGAAVTHATHILGGGKVE